MLQEIFVDGFHRALLAGGVVGRRDVAVLVAWTAVGLSAALRHFTWTPASAGA